VTTWRKNERDSSCASASAESSQPAPIAFFTNRIRRPFEAPVPGRRRVSPLGGEPLHFKGVCGGPESQPRRRSRSGVAFWTTDLVPQEHGYHGPNSHAGRLT